MSLKSIRIGSKTKSRLAKMGSLADSYDSVIVKMLDHVENCDRFWEDLK